MERTNRVFFLVGLLLLTSGVSAQSNRDVYRESAWAARDNWQKVPQILEAMGVNHGDQVADIGCHQGYMTVKLANAVAQDGRVYAVDLNSYRLEQLVENLEKRGIRDRVEVIKGDYNNPKLPENKLDAVIIMDTYHEMDSYEAILKHVKAALKENGRLVIIEPIAPSREGWSRKRQEDKHEIAMRYVLEDLQDAGFQIKYKVNGFVDRTEIKGDKMWMVVASNAPASGS